MALRKHRPQGTSLMVGLLFMLTASLGAAEPPTFLLETASGETFQGPLLGIAADGSLRHGGIPLEQVPAGEVISLRRVERTLPPWPRKAHLLFANGDRMPARIGTLRGEQLSVQFLGQPLTVPLGALSAVWASHPDGPETEDASRLLFRLPMETRTRDRLVLRNGDSLEGLVTGLDEAGVALEAEGKTLRVAWDRAAVLALNTELVLPLRPKTPYWKVLLRDGTRLSLSKLEGGGDRPFQGETLFKSKVTLPLDEITRLSVLNGAMVPMGDLKPKRIEQTSYGTETWPPVMGGSVDRRELIVDGSVHDHGLGTHSTTRLAYDLGSRYRRFEALVGLDPSSRRGQAKIRVLLDGKEQPLPADGVVTARGKGLRLRIEVKGVKELVLAVEDGEGGAVQDRVNWADAQLIR